MTDRRIYDDDYDDESNECDCITFTIIAHYTATRSKNLRFKFRTATSSDRLWVIIAVSIAFGFVINAKQMKFSLIVLVLKSNTLAKLSTCDV